MVVSRLAAPTDFNAIVMYRRSYRERDLLVKMLTDKIGPAMFYVRGAKKRGFKMAADILPFTHGHYIGTLSSHSLCYIRSASETKQYMHIASDLDCSAYASYILNLIDTAFDEGVAMGSWFDQVAAGLEKINAGLDPQIISNVFEVQMLGRFGVQPNWHQCVVCGQTKPPLDFSERYGGVLCQRHWHLDPDRMHLDQRTIKYLQIFSTLNLQNLHSVSVGAVTKKRLAWVLDTLYDDEVGLNLKTKRFIKQMTKWQKQLQNNSQAIKRKPKPDQSNSD